MKVGILTFPNSPSYGASLQMKALYTALNELGCDAEIINYRNTYMSNKKHVLYRNNSKIKNIAIAILDIPGKRKFKLFENKMRFYPEIILNETDDLSEIADRYDYLICGSDQVWNPDITGEDLHYFFDFCKYDNKKISYAASFGVNHLKHEYSLKVANELKKFKAISVREENGLEIIKKIAENNCNLVLDPTMLLKKNDWKKQEKIVKGLPKKYIVRFIFNHDETVEEYIDKLKTKTGLPVITIGGTVISRTKKNGLTGPVGPDEWLYIIDNAEYVVTDSFHGAAFSIIFNKQLFISLASSTNSRLKTLASTFKLDNNVIQNNKDSIGEIDYTLVNNIMDVKRSESINFLINSLNQE